MADHDVKIRVKAEGADAAAAKVGGIGKAFQRLIAPIVAVRKAAGTLFMALGTVGFVIHGISLIVDGVKRLHAWFGRAQKAAAEMAKAQTMRGVEKALEKAVERGKALAERTAEALANLKEIARQGAAERSAENGLAGAQTDYDEQQALAGVTDNEERQRIREEFALRRADEEKRAVARNSAAARQDINSQLNVAYDSMGREERYREGRDRDYSEAQRAWLKADREVTQQEAKNGPGKANAEDVQRRDALKKAADAILAEIHASDERTKELEKLTESLKHQRSLIDKEVQTAELRQRTAYAEVSNARAQREAERRERERKQVEEFVKISERNMQKARQQEAQDEIETKSEEIRKAEEALKAEPEVHQVRDRISAMGGFATAGAATLAGMSTGGDKSYNELRQHRDLLKQEVEQLKKIVKNTEEGAAVFG